MFKYPETLRAALYDFNIVGSIGGVNYIEEEFHGYFILSSK
jgi:hypothetical protein